MGGGEGKISPRRPRRDEWVKNDEVSGARLTFAEFTSRLVQQEKTGRVSKKYNPTTFVLSKAEG